jgi:polyisoprenoid-binding protein YceI
MTKRILFLALTVFAFQSVYAAEEAFQVDTAKSQLDWVAKKVTGEHHGSIDLKTGNLSFDNEKLTGGEFVIDMTSIENHDLEDETWNSKLVNHLKSDDFFSVENYPVSILKIKEVKNYMDKNSDENYWIIADLTIKGITNEIEFPAKVDKSAESVTALASVNVDRTKYDVKFRSGRFFSGLGDKLIYDDFNLNINLAATK